MFSSSKQYTTFSSKSITFIFKGQAAKALTICKDQCLYTPTMTEFNAVYSAVVSLFTYFRFQNVCRLRFHFDYHLSLLSVSFYQISLFFNLNIAFIFPPQLPTQMKLETFLPSRNSILQSVIHFAPFRRHVCQIELSRTPLITKLKYYAMSRICGVT